MQSPEVIQFLQSIQASVQEKNKPLSGSASPEQKSALCASTGVSQTRKAGASPAKGRHGAENLHGSSQMTRGSLLVNVRQQSHGLKDADQQTGTGDETSLLSTQQNLESQETSLTSSSSTAARAADVKFVSVSAVIPGTVQYVLQHNLHQVNGASALSSAASAGKNIDSGHNLLTSTAKHSQPSNVSSVARQSTRLVPASHSQTVGNRSSNNLATSASAQMHNPHLFSNASVQIESSRHHLITEWLNANINAADVGSGNDDLKEDLTEH